MSSSVWPSLAESMTASLGGVVDDADDDDDGGGDEDDAGGGDDDADDDADDDEVEGDGGGVVSLLPPGGVDCVDDGAVAWGSGGCCGSGCCVGGTVFVSVSGTTSFLTSVSFTSGSLAGSFSFLLFRSLIQQNNRYHQNKKDIV